MVINCDLFLSQPTNSDIIQLKNDGCVILDQHDDRLARTLLPLVTAIECILTLLAVGEAIITADQIV